MLIGRGWVAQLTRIQIKGITNNLLASDIFILFLCQRFGKSPDRLLVRCIFLVVHDYFGYPIVPYNPLE